MKQQHSLFTQLEKAYYELGHSDILEFKQSETNLRIASELKISTFQSMIFTVVFVHTVNDNYAMGLGALAEKLDMTNMRMFRHFDDLYKLQDMRLLDIEQRDRHNEFRVVIPKNTFNMILAGSSAAELDFRPKSYAELAERVREIMSETLRDSVQADNRVKALDDLFDSVSQLPEMKWMNSFHMRIEDKAMITYMMYAKMRSDDDTMSLGDLLERIYFSATRSLEERNRFVRNSHRLQRCGLLMLSSGFFIDGTGVALTELTISRLTGMSEHELKNKQEVRFKYLTRIKSSDIKMKKLLFDSTTQKDLSTIEKLLRPRSFRQFQTRAENRGLTKGLTVLMYGLPGTGKTETVKQFAAKAGRDILLVNISDIRDKYVGESEKRLNEIFVEYKKAVKTFKKEPILVFNEADALISKRTAVSSSVDQMNNSMQNILLQQMEDFEGILVATTNLKSSLDPAFERRFTLKFRFDMPSAGIYKKMLNARLTDLSAEQINMIGDNYRFTGGQIDNLVKNIEVKLLLGEEVSNEFLIRLCDAEGGKVKGVVQRQLGFRQDSQRRA